MSITYGGSQITFPDNSTQNTAPGGFGFKNRIINGNFQVAQRGTSFASLPVASATNNTYTLDRWAFAVSNSGDAGAITVSQVSGGGIRHAVTTANTSLSSIIAVSIRQIIEGYNCYDLAGQQVTVSFKVKTNKAGNYGLFIYDYTGPSYGTPQYITTVGSGAVETFTKTFTMPSTITADNAARLGLNLTLCAGSGRSGSWYPSGVSQVNFIDSTSNYFELYDVQLEKGSTATSFDYRPYGTELALCQRYFEKSFGIDVAPANAVNDSFLPTFVYYALNTGVSQFFSFKAEKRVAPTVTAYSSTIVASPTPGQWQFYNGSVWANATNTQVQRSSTSSFNISFTGSGSAGTSNFAGGHWAASSEL